MTITHDPEGNETKVLLDFVDFSGQRVLEIGCGDGRLTLRYAHKTAHVTAIDPDAGDIATAIQERPPDLKERVEFFVEDIVDYSLSKDSSKFDIAILSWSL